MFDRYERYSDCSWWLKIILLDEPKIDLIGRCMGKIHGRVFYVICPEY